MQTLIKCCILWHLIWVFTVFQGTCVPVSKMKRSKSNFISRKPDQNFLCFYSCDVIVMLKWRHHVAPQRIQDFLRAFYMFFQYRMRYLVVSRKKNPLFVWGWDRRICPLRSPFVINRQASSVILKADFSIPPSHSWWIFIVYAISFKISLTATFVRYCFSFNVLHSVPWYVYFASNFIIYIWQICTSYFFLHIIIKQGE